MSVASIGKHLINVTENIIKLMKEGVELQLNQNATDADRAAYEQKWQNLGEDTSSSTKDLAKVEAKEVTTKHLMNGGWTKEQAECWFDSKWQDFTEFGEKARKLRPSVKKVANYAWAKALGVIAAGVVIVGSIIASHTINLDVARRNTEQAKRDTIQRAEYEERMKVQPIQYSADQWNIMMGGLLVAPSAPAVQPSPDLPPAQAALAPAVAAMPAAVAAEAEEPVEVYVTTSSGTQTYPSTLGRVYQNIPETRHDIEQEAPKIDHGYDHPDSTSCVTTDCLNQHTEEFNRRTQEMNHKEWTVTSEVGTVTVRR